MPDIMAEFICPDCGKHFGNNREWFNDHRIAHKYNDNPVRVHMIRVEEQKATLKSISNSIRADRIRVWMNFDGEICFENTKTKNVTSFKPYYDLNGNVNDEET